MILRRFAQALKEQNWTSITIEFALLVLGVFLGIQAANWNEARQTGEKSGVFSERLKDDLRREAQRYLFLQEYYRDVQAATEASANALTGKLPLSNEALLINAYRATQYRAAPSFRTTYDELIATGNLGLIEDRTMLNLALAVYRLNSLELLERDSIASRYRVLFREGIPHDVQRTLASRCGDRFIEIDGKIDRDHVIDYPCTSELPADDIDAAANALRADPKILRQLSKRVVDLDSHLANLAANMRSTFERNAEIFGEAP